MQLEKWLLLAWQTVISLKGLLQEAQQQLRLETSFTNFSSYANSSLFWINRNLSPITHALASRNYYFNTLHMRLPVWKLPISPRCATRPLEGVRHREQVVLLLGELHSFLLFSGHQRNGLMFLAQISISALSSVPWESSLFLSLIEGYCEMGAMRAKRLFGLSPHLCLVCPHSSSS